MKVGSLFSGIGGLELGLERTGGFQTIWFCENEPYASAVLKKHWPGIPNLGDITKVDWNGVEKPDMLAGGFPCQDISIAGKGKGIREGTRSGLWFEYARAIRTLRPRYALIENVPMLAKRGLDIVLADLAEMGYDAEWFTLSAAEAGAWHRRERLFILAHPHKSGCVHGQAEIQPAEARVDAQREPVPKSQDVPDSKSFGRQWDGNARTGGDGFEDSDKIPDSPCLGVERRGAYREQVSRIQALERISRRHRAANQRGIWAAEPGVGRVADGVPDRIHRIKCLGNAVVPQVAETIGRWILEVYE